METSLKTEIILMVTIEPGEQAGKFILLQNQRVAIEKSPFSLLGEGAGMRG